jgi:hypothetical protein
MKRVMVFAMCTAYLCGVPIAEGHTPPSGATKRAVAQEFKARCDGWKQDNLLKSCGTPVLRRVSSSKHLIRFKGHMSGMGLHGKNFSWNLAADAGYLNDDSAQRIAVHVITMTCVSCIT